MLMTQRNTTMGVSGLSGEALGGVCIPSRGLVYRGEVSRLCGPEMRRKDPLPAGLLEGKPAAACRVAGIPGAHHDGGLGP